MAILLNELDRVAVCYGLVINFIYSGGSLGIYLEPWKWVENVGGVWSHKTFGLLNMCRWYCLNLNSQREFRLLLDVIALIYPAVLFLSFFELTLIWQLKNEVGEEITEKVKLSTFDQTIFKNIRICM